MDRIVSYLYEMIKFVGTLYVWYFYFFMKFNDIV